MMIIRCTVFLVCVTSVICNGYPPYCRQDEVVDDCVNGGCRRRNCSQLAEPKVCIDPTHCDTGCRCRDGYLRDANGMCVPVTSCPIPVCKQGEIFDFCPGYCQPQCNVDQSLILCQPSPQPGDPDCDPGCRCADNLYRTTEGACVPKEYCPLICPYGEVYEECPDPCVPNVCASIWSRYRPCPPCRPEDCKPTCRCPDGQYRNKIGQCITAEECMLCNGPNEYFSCGGACDNECDKLNEQSIDNCPIINIQCNRQCYCEDGYARDANNICIPINECPPPRCPYGEVYEECPDPCIPNVCASIWSTYIPCPPCRPEDCKPTCRCPDGQYRNAIGQCITTDECLQCNGPHEYFSCGGACDNECDKLSRQSQNNCPIINIQCNKQCYCEDGYARDANNICIPINQCPPECPVNERYVNNINEICRAKTCSELGQPLPCLQPGYDNRGPPGCICIDGYIRNYNGVCVPVRDCPACGGDFNATVGPGTFCITCDNYKIKNVACSDVALVNGCGCRDNYVYNRQIKQCVLPQDCPPKCPNGEVYEQCPDPCVPNVCSSIWSRYIPCPPCRPEDCKPTCRCPDGKYRNKIGQCITAEECTKCKGPHEYFSCGGACDNECDKLSRQSQNNCPIINIQCNKQCYCEDGYARDANNICIPINQCPPECPVNERYVNNINEICRAKTCSELGQPLPCLQPGYDNSGPPGCICIDGYIRNYNGVCVPVRECPACGGDFNATVGPGTFCITCDNYKIKNVACSDVAVVNGCGCRDNYVYNRQIKQCVLPQDCPPKCPNGEVYEECPDPCVPNVCESIWSKYKPCPPCRPEDCKPTCRCPNGKYRNKIGQCITAEECSKCKGPHEYFSCGVACDNECDKLSRQSKNNCPIINIQCNRQCYCEDGYARDSNNICIPINQCPPECPVNERYVNNINEICRAKTCSELGQPLPCLQPGYDNRGPPGCICIDGYIRNYNGVCVPVRDCPACGGDFNATTGPGTFCITCDNYKIKNVACSDVALVNGCGCRDNYVYNSRIKQCVLPQDCPPKCPNGEVYEECPDPCVPNVCESIWSKYKPCPPCRPEDCKPTCRCPNGKYRNKIGQCITAEECSKCKGPHEYFSCGGACDNECDKLSRQSKNNCPIINIQCNKQCYCEDGYARDANNICIPINQCPPECPVNERYVNNINEICRAKTCSELGQPLPCLQPGYDNRGPPGCICIDGYIRNYNGVCVPVRECPACGGDFNATTGPGTFCITCDNYKNANHVICPLVIKINGCGCRDNYVYNRQIKQCVLPQDCPPKCPNGEVYEECPDPCVPNVCESIWSKYKPCPPCRPEDCKPTCRCPNGKYRNKIGQCISAEECSKCKGPHEYFSCGGACDNECDKLSRQSKNNCPIINIQCNKQCYCEDGYARDANNICIPIKQCPPECPINERYVKNINEICRAKTCSELGQPLPCRQPGYDNRGPPGCICIDGYIRNNKGVCVPVRDCPACGGDRNATTGPGTFCITCDNYNIKNVACPAVAVENGCGCRDNYVYNRQIKQCVLPQDCPPKCPNGEVYEKCPDPCVPNVCESIWSKYKPCPPCRPEDCKPTCRCPNGKYRNKIGQCITAEECSKCKGPHEYFSCGVACDNECDKLSRQSKNNCPIINIQCNRQCYCEDGYARDANNICIPINQCPPECPVNERYVKNINKICRAKTCSELGLPLPCLQDGYDNRGPPGCICIDGYIRNKHGVCVPTHECPACGGDYNATTGPGTFCINCDNYKNKHHVICPLIIKVNGCGCRDNYVYNRQIKQCVLPQDCPRKHHNDGC